MCWGEFVVVCLGEGIVVGSGYTLGGGHTTLGVLSGYGVVFIPAVVTVVVGHLWWTDRVS